MFFNTRAIGATNSALGAAPNNTAPLTTGLLASKRSKINGAGKPKLRLNKRPIGELTKA